LKQIKDQNDSLLKFNETLKNDMDIMKKENEDIVENMKKEYQLTISNLKSKINNKTL
jgi:hypothetical protein